MDKPTPGPWIYTLSPKRQTPCVLSETTWICGEIDNPNSTISPAEVAANGMLIAASPDLATSLRATVRQLDAVKVCINDPECRAITERKIADARSVLMAAGIDPDGGA